MNFFEFVNILEPTMTVAIANNIRSLFGANPTDGRQLRHIRFIKINNGTTGSLGGFPVAEVPPAVVVGAVAVDVSPFSGTYRLS